MELLNSFNIKWEYVLPQLVNFLIILFVLYKFGYKPILKFVEERTKKIEEGVKNAERAAESLQDANKQSEHILASAHKEAQNIIKTAREQATEQANLVQEQKKEELRQIAEKAKKQIMEEKDKILRETKDQAVALVLQATEQLLKEKMDEKKDAQYVETVMKELS